jgi:DNA-binding NarL/FixJ family response regulator
MAKRNKQLRIVVADDHELVRQGIRNLLSQCRGWKVVGEAANGEQAIRMTQTLRPQVLIMDITMPQLDGLEATRRIKASLPETSILILTMHESDQMVRRILKAGALAYVLKSDLAAQLVKAVNEVSHGRLFLTPKVTEIVVRGFLNAEKELSAQRHEAITTPRETEIMRLLVGGKSNKEIGSVLGIAVRTVETYRAKIMLKLGVHSISELIHYALNHELVSMPQPSVRVATNLVTNQ